MIVARIFNMYGHRFKHTILSFKHLVCARHLKVDKNGRGFVNPLSLDGVTHYSSIGTIPIHVPNKDLYEINSYAEHSNGLCMSSSESTNMPSFMTQPLVYTTDQFQSLDNSEFCVCSYDGHHMNNNSLNLTTTMVAEDFKIAESSWVENDFACITTSTWDLNELLQVRNTQK